MTRWDEAEKLLEECREEVILYLKARNGGQVAKGSLWGRFIATAEFVGEDRLEHLV